MTALFLALLVSVGGGVFGALAPLAVAADPGETESTMTESATTETAETTVLAAAATPDFEHVVVTSAGATAYVQKDISIDSDATLRIIGQGWQDQAGTGGSTVAVKLNGPTGQYQRSGDLLIEHPSAPGDTTIWALISPSPAAQDNEFAVGADGSFDITVDAPAGLVAGQLLSVTLQAGRFAAGDTQRSVTTEPLLVGGVAYVPPTTGDTGGDDDPIEHTGVEYTGTSDPSVTFFLPEGVEEGSVIVVSGKGWLTTDGSAGSVIAFKFDDGAVNTKLEVTNPANGIVQTNKSIVGVVKANSAGDWRIELPFPDGVNADAVFSAGQTHNVRMLTGSLLPGDKIRTEVAEFTVVPQGSTGPVIPGKPSGVPDPMEATEDLTEATRGGVTATADGDLVIVTIPPAAAAAAASTGRMSLSGASEGDWVYLNLFEDSSPLFPFGANWYQVSAAGAVTADLAGYDLDPGSYKLSVQDRTGALVGWALLDLSAPEETTSSTPVTTSTSTSPSETTTTTTTTTPTSGTTGQPTSTSTSGSATGGKELSQTGASVESMAVLGGALILLGGLLLVLDRRRYRPAHLGR